MCDYTNLVVSREASPQTIPTTGYYVEDLEGITIPDMAEWTSSDKRSAKNMVKKVVERAIKQLETRVAEEMLNQRYNIQTQPLAWPDCYHDFNFHQPTTDRRGLRIIKSRNLSPLSAIFVEELVLMTLDGGDVEVQALARDFTVLQTTIITGLQPRTPKAKTVNWTFEGQDLVYLITNSPAQRFAQTSCRIPSHCCSGVKIPKKNYDHSFFEVSGWRENLPITSDSFGIVARVGLKCTIKGVMCELLKLEQFKRAMFYETGVQLLNEYLASKRINFVTINNEEEGEERRARWDEEVGRLVKSGVASAGPNISGYDSYCVECRHNPKTVSIV